jgi:hypothetical protein
VAWRGVGWFGLADTTLSDLGDLVIHCGVRGAIESLKLFPDRNCAFIAFVDHAPATHFMEHALFSSTGTIHGSPSLITQPNGAFAVAPAPGAASTATATATTTKPANGGASAAGATSGTNSHINSTNGSGSSALQALAAAQQPSPHVQTNSGLLIHNKRVRVGWGSPDPLNAAVAEAISHGATRTVFLGGLDASTTELSLTSQFTPIYGPIEKLDVLHHKRIAFVHFASIGSAVACVQALQQQQVPFFFFFFFFFFSRCFCSQPETHLMNALHDCVCNCWL